MSPLGRRSRKGGGRKRGMNPIAISIITIALVFAVVYYAFSQQIPFVSKFTLHALVNNSLQVRTDSPVRIAGVDVGTVENVTKGPGTTSQINFTIDDNGLPIHNDATILIKDRLFLEGGYYLALNPGSPSAPVLHDGDTIPTSHTTYPVQFYNLLSTFDGFTRQSLENLLNTLNDSLSPLDSHNRPVAHPGAVALKQTFPQLTPTFKDVAIVTRALHGTHAGDVQNLLSSTSNITTTLQHNSSQLTDLVTSLNRTAGALDSADGALAQSVSGLDQTLQVAPNALTAIDRSLPPLASLGTALDPSLKLAPGIIDGLTRAVTALGAVVAPTARGHLLTSLKAAFQQFPSILTQVATLFPITKGVTDCLKNNVEPILNAVVPDGSLSTGQPVWKEFVHFLPDLASAGMNFDANGNWTRLGPIGVGTNTLAGLGSLPIVGQLFGTGLPGGSSLQGSRPVWVGPLGPDAYHPEVACSTQQVPNLASANGAPDFRSSHTPAAQPLSLKQLESAIRRQSKAGGR
jgi:virulence factor Mce-like protein